MFDDDINYRDRKIKQLDKKLKGIRAQKKKVDR